MDHKTSSPSKIYLDNAATTPLSKEVADIMHEANLELLGNPSSIHSFGRSVRAKIEMARKNIAAVVNADAGEIVFTSGGTEANNSVFSFAKALGVKRIISSPIEHYAILNPLSKLEETFEVDYVKLNDKGDVDLTHLQKLLSNGPKTLVSLMHVNNEIGNVLPIMQVADLCKTAGALFHSDTVQSLAYFDVDVKALGIDLLSCSAHKFHGPKGVGFIYIKQELSVQPFIAGGSQEKGLRGGTENISGIIGLEKALLTAKSIRTQTVSELKALKSYLTNQLDEHQLDYSLNGNWENSSPAIANISFNTARDVSMLLFNLDLAGVAISGGSACTSGSNKGSHVLQAIGVPMDQPAIRISFSKYNTEKDIEGLCLILQKLLST